MKKLIIAASLALAACATPTGSLQDRAAITATNSLSLAELAFTSMEQAATAYVNSPDVSKTDAQRVGVLVLQARGYRDQARQLAASGQDTSAALQSLNTIILNINAITGAKK